MTDKNIKREPSTPVPAATVILLRDTDTSPEVFMVVRRDHAVDRFSGALVFPGGKVDERDASDAIQSRCVQPSGCSDYDLALRVAAIREAFEESGVLLARHRGSGKMISAQDMSRLGVHRESVERGEIAFESLLEEHDLELAIDQLVHFGHWVTPPMAPKRFDTHFFAAAVAVDVEPLHCGRETVDCVWKRPDQLLFEGDKGKWNIVFPTRCNLAKVAQFSSLSALIEQCATEKVVTVSPKVTREGDTITLRIPEDAGYPINSQVLPARQA